MENSIAAGGRSWICARSTGFADGYLLWMPPLLISFDRSASLSSSLAALLTLLLVAAVFWADGRGRAESWAETLFAFGWIGVWSPAAGLLVLELDGGGDRSWLWAALCLAAGAAVLAGSWGSRRRRSLERTQRPAAFATGTVIWLGTGALLLLLWLGSDSLLWADVGVLCLASVFYLVLAPRGRAARTCGAPR